MVPNEEYPNMSIITFKQFFTDSRQAGSKASGSGIRSVLFIQVNKPMQQKTNKII